MTNFHTDSFAAFDNDPLHERMGQDGQVGPIHEREGV
jgi:hypothetical protein